MSATLHLVAVFARRPHLDEHQLAFDVVPSVKSTTFGDFDQLVQLLVICSMTSSDRW
jgi:hypothetical protein